MLVKVAALVVLLLVGGCTTLSVPATRVEIIPLPGPEMTLRTTCDRPASLHALPGAPGGVPGSVTYGALLGSIPPCTEVQPLRAGLSPAHREVWLWVGRGDQEGWIAPGALEVCGPGGCTPLREWSERYPSFGYCRECW